MRIAVLMVVLVLARTAHAYNYGIEAGKIVTTRASASDASIYRVWASDEGNVVSRYDTPLPTGGSKWTNHGNGGGAVPLYGVTATWYISGGSIYEHVFYVSGFTLYMGTSIDRGPISWSAWATPTSPITAFLGHLAVTTVFSGGQRYFIVVGVYGGALWRWVRQTSGGTATWTYVGVLNWGGQYGVVATTDATETHTVFFTDHNPGTSSVGLMRWDPATGYTIQDIGHPVGQSCAPVAAIQGPFSTILALGYRLTLACTNSNGTFHLASAPSETSSAFTWTSYNLGTPSAFPNVAGAVRPSTTPNYLVHEFFYATGANVLTKVDLGTTTASVTDIGATKDIDVFSGGIAVAPRTGASRVFYLAGLTNATRLFERLGSATNTAADYRWLGSPSTLPFWATPSRAAEGKVAGWKGTEAMSMVNRPGSGVADWPTVYLMFTSNQNETADFSTTKPVSKDVNIPGVGVTTHEYTSDPTVVMTDTKRAYSIQIGVKMTGCVSSSIITRASIYMVSTADGITHSTPSLIATSTINQGTSSPLDHPWSDIEHVTGGNDIIHIVWWNVATNRIQYSRYTENVGLGPTFDLGSVAVTGPPRITVSDAGRAIAYFGDMTGNVYLCEINSSHTGCTTPPGSASGWKAVTTYAKHDVQVGAGTFIEAADPISMVASESDTNALNYCVDVLESNGTNTDVRCGRMARDANGAWTVAASAIVNSVANDAKDQFLPEVVLTSEDDAFASGQDTVIATWYDRANSPTNYAYQVMKAVSFDGGTSFGSPIIGYSAFSDPEYLPRHCRKPAVRFLGDYNAAEGDILHKNVGAVLVPPGTTIGTWVFSFPMGLGSWSN